MSIQRITELRGQALSQLNGYRRGCPAAHVGKGGLAKARAWRRVIARVHAVLEEEEPLKACFMARMFGLDRPIPRRNTARERLLTLAWELNCSEATLYKWRAEIVELVLYGAIEAALLRPGLTGRTGRTQKKKL